MASQQPPTRAWFRLPSMTRPTAPAPATLAQTQPPASRPMPPIVRPTFRPPVAQPQQTQPQAPAPPPTPPVAAPPPATASPPPRPVAAPPHATTSIPSYPIIKVSASSSLPSSPAAKPSPKSTIPPVESSSSVSLSPKPKTSFSLPTSPAYASKESPVPSGEYTSAVPPSPNIKVLSASSSSLPTSPAPKVMSPLVPPSHISATTTAVTARAATPTSSPKAKNPPLSPELKPVSIPPSPLVLPPAQIKFDSKTETKIPAESEQKTILMQKTFEEPKVMPNTSKGHKGFYKKYSESEDFGKRVITIAGENRGAVMELSPSRKNLDIAGNHHSLHKKGNSIALISDDEQSERDGNEEGRSKVNDKTHKMAAMVSPLKTAFINSNVQGVNNSILYNSFFTHHDPGVHLSLSGKANGGRGANLKD